MLTEGIALGIDPFPPIRLQVRNHVILESICQKTLAINLVGCGLIKVVNPVRMHLMKLIVQLHLMVITDPVGSEIIIVTVQLRRGNAFII